MEMNVITRWKYYSGEYKKKIVQLLANEFILIEHGDEYVFFHYLKGIKGNDIVFDEVYNKAYIKSFKIIVLKRDIESFSKQKQKEHTLLFGKIKRLKVFETKEEMSQHIKFLEEQLSSGIHM